MISTGVRADTGTHPLAQIRFLVIGVGFFLGGLIRWSARSGRQSPAKRPVNPEEGIRQMRSGLDCRTGLGPISFDQIMIKIRVVNAESTRYSICEKQRKEQRRPACVPEAVHVHISETGDEVIARSVNNACILGHMDDLAWTDLTDPVV